LYWEFGFIKATQGGMFPDIDNPLGKLILELNLAEGMKRGGFIRKEN